MGRPRKIKDTDSESFTDTANAAGLAKLASGLPSKREMPKKSPRLDDDEMYASVQVGSYIPKRRWRCQSRERCKGRVNFTSWEQLLDPPDCPVCGGAMDWHQWLVIKKAA